MTLPFGSPHSRYLTKFLLVPLDVEHHLLVVDEEVDLHAQLVARLDAVFEFLPGAQAGSGV